MSVLTPADENECRQALYTAFCHDHPTAVRYPRGAGAGVAVQSAMTALPFGKGEIRRQIKGPSAPVGKRIAILAFGTLLYPALTAAESLDATVANMRFVKPLDVALVTELAASHDAIVTVEEGCVMGGAGSAVLEALAAAQIKVPVLTLGLPDAFIQHGDPTKLLAMCGLDAAGIEASIRTRFG
jgi:1-deoxy-D-xylulose-5-phosphate synthase